MNGLGRKNEENTEKVNLLTKETLGVVLVLFSTICLVCLISRDLVFYTPGKLVNAFLGGVFGYSAYLVTIGLIIYGVTLITGNKLPVAKKTKIIATLFFVVLVTFLHVLSTSGTNLNFTDYLIYSYNMAEQGVRYASAGGICTAFLAHVLVSLLSYTGSLVVLGAIEAIIIYYLLKTNNENKIKKTEQEKFKSSFVKSTDTINGEEVVISGERDYPVEGVNYQSRPQQKLFINNADDFTVKTKREKAKEDENPLKVNYAQNGLAYCESSNTYSKSYEEDLKKKLDYIKTPPTIEVGKKENPIYQSKNTTFVSDYVKPEPKVELKPIEEQKSNVEIPMFEHNQTVETNSAKSHAESFADRYADFSQVEEQPSVKITEQTDFTEEEISLATEEYLAQVEDKAVEPAVEEKQGEEQVVESVEPIEPTQPPINERRARVSLFDQTPSTPEVKETSYTRNSNVGFVPEKAEEKKEEKPKKVVPINRKYVKPPIDLLETYNTHIDVNSENHEERKEVIKRTLEEFHINVVPQGHVQGPTVTRYEIMMPAGISVKKVLNYDDDLKMRLESKNGVRIEAPIPGKNLVGIEVANKTKVTVGLKEILMASSSKPSKPGSLIFALGKDIVGNAITDNLAKGPHYLVAGATGSGKSVCLNVMIISLIMRYSPEELRLVLIDPKSVGFRIYEHIPHLLIDEIITDAQKSLTILQWAYDEMEKRYRMFAECPGVVSDIDAYNQEIASATVPKMPRIVIVIDELADLMETCKKDMEARIRALAQKARAAGIHLVLATQRPSVDIITGTIKANLPSRIALKVMNFADSNTIMSEGGAEKLLGNGDMLFKNSSMSETERYQGAWISDREINNVVTFIKENNEAYFDEELKEALNKPERTSDGDEYSSSTDENEVDETFLKALWFVINTGTAAISQLQRRFSIGYPRAGAIIDKMERLNFIGPNEGSKTRKVLITREQFEEKFGPRPDTY